MPIPHFIKWSLCTYKYNWYGAGRLLDSFFFSSKMETNAYLSGIFICPFVASAYSWKLIVHSLWWFVSTTFIFRCGSRFHSIFGTICGNFIIWNMMRRLQILKIDISIVVLFDKVIYCFLSQAPFRDNRLEHDHQMRICQCIINSKATTINDITSRT